MVSTDTAEHCAQRVRQANRPRFVASLFAPAEHRRRLLALYAFDEELQHIREAAREPLIVAMRFQWWRDAIGRLPDHPIGHPVLTELSSGGFGGELSAIVDAREGDAAHAEALLVARAAELCGGQRENALAAAVGHALEARDTNALREARQWWTRVRRMRRTELPAYLPATVVDMRHPVTPLRLYWRMLVMGARNRF